MVSSAKLASGAIPSPSVVKTIEKVRKQKQEAEAKSKRELDAWILERKLAEEEANKKLKAEQEVAAARIAELEPLAKTFEKLNPYYSRSYETDAWRACKEIRWLKYKYFGGQNPYEKSYDPTSCTI